MKKKTVHCTGWCMLYTVQDGALFRMPHCCTQFSDGTIERFEKAAVTVIFIMFAVTALNSRGRECSYYELITAVVTSNFIINTFCGV